MRRAAVLALLLALAAAAPAAAQSGTVGGAGAGFPVAGPTFGGGEIVWVEQDGANLRLVGGDVGRPAHVLATATMPPPAQAVTTAFGASDSSVLLWVMSTFRVKGIEEPLGVEAFAGPRGALRPLTGEATAPFRFPRLVGERVAFNVSFPGGGGAVRFLDPVSGEQSEVPMPTFSSPWSAAGDVVAHLRADEARAPAVTNWRTGAELYRAALPPGWQPAAVDVTADGTALWTATVEGDGTRSYVHGVSTPEAPAIRQVPLPAGALVYELAAGRVLYWSQPDWAVADLDGRVVARLADRPLSLMPGTDGRRLAYLTRPCALPVVQVFEIDRPPAAKGVPPAPCLAARLARRPAVRSGGLRVSLRCDGSPGAGCLTDVAVTVRRRGRRTLRFEVPQHALVTGEQRVLSLGRRRQLRGRLRVTVVLRESNGEAFEVDRFRIRG